MAMIHFSFMFVIGLLSWESAEGVISCYMCSSKGDGPWCLTGDGTRNETEPEECQGVRHHNVCTKTYTQFYKITKRGRAEPYAVYVSRECGKSWWTGCRKTVGPQSYSIHCQCYGDGCNTANHATGPLTMLAALLLSSFGFV